jgi:hypothetical protein
MKLSEHRIQQIQEIDARFEARRPEQTITSKPDQQWRDIGDLLDIVEFLQIALDEEKSKRARWLEVVAALGVQMMNED